MKYRQWKNGVRTVYAYGMVNETLYSGGEYNPETDRKDPGDFTFQFQDSRRITHPGLEDWSYGSFHGLTLSMDGTKFYLQGWENGIRAYDVLSGRLVWKNRIRHTRNLLVSENTLLAVTGDKKLVAMSAQKGLVTAERPGIREVIDVTENLCLGIAVSRKESYLLDKDTLDVLLTLPAIPHCCTVDVLPMGNRLYTLIRTLADTKPRYEVYALQELPLPADADPVLWESRYTVRRLQIYRDVYGLDMDAVTENARDDLFRIDYAIAEPEKQFADPAGGAVYGMLRFRMGKEEYGLWYHGKDSRIPYDVSLLYWMEGLEETLRRTRLGGKAYLRDIHTPRTWLRFRSRHGDSTNQLFINVVRTAEELPEIGMIPCLPVSEKEMWERDVCIPFSFFEAEVTEVSKRMKEEITAWQNSISGEENAIG